MPGIYVVTSTELVKRTRATLRSAEFGFFGVWVYTRMHTPRFSGQPASAGDFVFTRTFSRPILTNCENVGTVVPRILDCTAIHFARKNFPWLSQGARQKCARAHNSAERSTANPEIQPARNSVRTPRGRTIPLASVRRGLLGFAGLAPHSGRSSVPFRRSLFRDRRYFPSNYFEQTAPDKQQSIKKKESSVKSFDTLKRKTSVENVGLAPALPTAISIQFAVSIPQIALGVLLPPVARKCSIGCQKVCRCYSFPRTELKINALGDIQRVNGKDRPDMP